MPDPLPAPRHHRRAAGLVLVALLAACAGGGRVAHPAGADLEPVDPALRESVIRLPVAGTAAEIVVSAYRPPGPGPFPWILLSHGTATTIEANRVIGRYRNPALLREWLGRGYAVVVPVRRGYGASGGERLGDDYGGCARADFHRAGSEAARDLTAAIAWARTQPELDPARWLLVGQSAGGFASIFTASLQPAGLQAVLAFAPGRGGNPETRPGAPCAADRMADTLAAIAPRIRVPVLWFYARNDAYIGPAAQQLWFDRFRAAGGRGQLVVIPPFAHRLGHGVFPSPEGVPLWTAAVAEFLRSQRVPMPFAMR